MFNFNRRITPDIQHEQQVGQQQIKIVSKKRFYQMLEKVEDVFQRKYGERNKQLKEERGLDYITKGFKNSPIYGNENNKWKFRTNNSLNEYAAYCNFFESEGTRFLEFIINTTDNPIARTKNFSDLNYFEVEDKVKTYSFNILGYIGGRQINPFEIGHIFQCEVIKYGEYDFDMDDTERILTAKDCPPKTTHTLSQDDFTPPEFL